MARVLLAVDWAAAQTVAADVTIEAEYGVNVAVGALATAAHHQASGPYGPTAVAPCNDRQLSSLDPNRVSTILVSHLDLDTVGGCLRVLGHDALFTTELAPFWELAEHVDLHGPHSIDDEHDDEHDDGEGVAWPRVAIHAYWAWAMTQPRRARATGVVDVTSAVLAAADALRAILVDRDQVLLIAGVRLERDNTARNERTWVRKCATPAGWIGVRRGAEFCNDLYRSPSGVELCAIIAHNTKTGAITVSVRVPSESGLDCRTFAQHLWGAEAGGHAGIAGSPRGRVMTDAEFAAAVDELALAL